MYTRVLVACSLALSNACALAQCAFEYGRDVHMLAYIIRRGPRHMRQARARLAPPPAVRVLVLERRVEVERVGVQHAYAVGMVRMAA